MNENLSDEDLKSSIAFMTNPPIINDLKTPAKRNLLSTNRISFDIDSKPKATNQIDFDIDSKPIVKGQIIDSEDVLTNQELSSLLTNQCPVEMTECVDRLGTSILNLIDHVQEIEVGVLQREEVATDLIAITAGLTGLANSMGVDQQGTFQDLWSGINELSACVDGIDLQDLQDSLTNVSINVTRIEEQLLKNDSHWKILAMKWLPKIQSHETSITNMKLKLESQSNLSKVVPAPHDLSSMLLGIQAPSITPTQIFSSDQDKDRQITELKNKLIDLESRLLNQENKLNEYDNQSAPGTSRNEAITGLGFKGVTYKQYYFSNPAEVKLWMKKNMTHPSHGLFVDLNSFSEFFGGDRYIEMKATLNELYMSTKIGHSTIADSVVAASFQNILPGAYARVSSIGRSTSEAEMVSQAELPGLPSFSKWDARDGRNGRRFWIRDETRKTEQQLDGWIRTQLAGPAQLLGKDLLVDSCAMSEALYTFISTSYDDTMHSGKFDSDQAWALTSSFVKRIFTELSHVRVIARDGVHVDDPWSTGATFLFATLKAHVIMEQFMRLSIKDHPSISSEMVKFVCYSQPASDASALESRVTAVEALQRSDQSILSKLEPRVKRMETWKAEADKWIKKLKEKTGLS